MDLLGAIEKVLAVAGEPLRYLEITQRVLSQGPWKTDGKTPAATITARLSVDIKDHGNGSRFERCAPGKYGLTASTALTVTPALAAPRPPGHPGPASPNSSYNTWCADAQQIGGDRRRSSR